MFSGIKIPDTIEIPETDMFLLEELASRHGESARAYISGSIGLIAAWGLIIEDCGFSPNIIQGIADHEEDAVYAFDIPAMCDELGPAFEMRKTVQLELGLETIESLQDRNLKEFKIGCDGYIDKLQVACGFYGRDLVRLASVAVDLRHFIITEQAQDRPYVFSDDGENWTVIELSTQEN